MADLTISNGVINSKVITKTNGTIASHLITTKTKVIVKENGIIKAKLIKDKRVIVKENSSIVGRVL